MADEATTVKARKLEELRAVKDQEIENVQEQLEELEEEVQECGVMLTNWDNMINNLLAEIHELQLQQAPTPAAPAKDPAPSSNVEDF
jgi:peptidoglycan hydrolase CwlO-like protein